MTQQPGSHLGPYEILASIGAGGMGEVYKARDPRLDRDVAIKIANEAFSDRFTREARAIAALNHTNICHLYDVGPDYLVLEFVEGDTLQGPMAFDEALPIIRQLIDGIEAAHERNIVHRDLKPANIKITPDGVLKILDFGLAKAMEQNTASGFNRKDDVTHSPTVAIPSGVTQQGAILGTSAYMAPEQAKGKQADKRSDIWAFGVIVYELLTGRKLFEGETAIEILGQVLNKTPDLSAAPPRAQKLLAWCLEKDRKDRLQAIGDARRLLIDEPAAVVAAAAPKRSMWSYAGWAVAALAIVVLAGVTWRGGRETPGASLHLAVPLPDNVAPAFLALSPNGRQLAIIPSGLQELIVRSLDSGDVHTMTGILAARTPFWSPDNRTIAFFADGALKTVPASGGPPRVLCTDTGLGGGGSWSRNGVILFATGDGALRRTTADGGACEDVITAQPDRRVRLPVFLPDGDHFLSARSNGSGNQVQLFTASLSEPAGHLLLADSTSAEFVADGPGLTTGHLMFVREQRLTAQAFDLSSLQLSGEPSVVADQVGFTSTSPQVAASTSESGTLMFVSNGRPDRELAWYDRAGKRLGRVADVEQGGGGVSLAPDGRRTVFRRTNAQNVSETQLVDLDRHQETRLFAPPLAPSVVWSPDARRVAFGALVEKTPGLYVRTISGGKEELLLRQNAGQRDPSDWSRDGRWIVYTEVDPKTRGDIWLLPVASRPSPGQPVPLVRTPAIESQGRISPDGRWFAHYSDEVGKGQIYVRPFAAAGPTSDTPWIVPASGFAREPSWRADGKELFFMENVTGTRRFKMMAVAIGAAPNPIGIPKMLFEFQTIPSVPQSNSFSYAASADGQRFLVNEFATEAQPTLDVILNWPASLKK